MPRPRSIAAALLLAAVAACDRAPPPGPASSPPVILISIDCLNQRQLEEGLARGDLPTLASIARDARVFGRAYSHSPWTNPSHISMLTGLYPSQHGRDVPYGLMLRYDRQYGRVPDHPTLPGHLAARGYESAAFVGQGSISKYFGTSRGFDRWAEAAKNQRYTDLDRTVEAVTTWLRERDSSRPYFLFLHTYDFHAPLPVGHDKVESALAYVDGKLAAVLEALRASGDYDRALLFVTGDHGSAMIRTEGKCCVHGAGHYEENLKVPLLVKLPGVSAKGPSDRIARHVDLFPTVLDVLGSSEPGYRGPGVSLLSDDPPRVSFSEADGRCAIRYGLVTATHKYIYTPQDDRQAVYRSYDHFVDEGCTGVCRDRLPTEEMYDLRSDPFEERNLLQGLVQDAQVKVAEEFRGVLDHHLGLPVGYRPRMVTDLMAAAEDAERATPRDDVQDALCTLGYLDPDDCP